ncbi:hypothetical protein HPP92_028734 [Vanilla planifolia]|uniref:Uncharacterized protein n=1 Tax=Vanilla planifolia TaxID=51239 RepID=A0A835U3R0_VANPL|nr:hypothetical protein HPP92_028734 [Vanilla planifolia]KAG0446680.1 hypothetical protein HPP92_028722 [Vanilla planifolia]
MKRNGTEFGSRPLERRKDILMAILIFDFLSFPSSLQRTNDPIRADLRPERNVPFYLRRIPCGKRPSTFDHILRPTSVQIENVFSFTLTRVFTACSTRCP